MRVHRVKSWPRFGQTRTHLTSPPAPPPGTHECERRGHQTVETIACACGRDGRICKPHAGPRSRIPAKLEAHSRRQALSAPTASVKGATTDQVADALGHTVYAVYSLARLHRAPRATLDDISRVLQQPCDASGQHFSALLQARDCVQLASAFKSTNTPAPRLFHAMAMTLSERGDIDRMKHEEVIGVADSFSAVHMLSPALFCKLSDRIHELAGRDDDRFTPRALAVAANALSRWQRVSLSGAAQRASSTRETARESVQAAQQASLTAMARMMPRVTRICRSHRVAHLDPQAFTAQGIAMLAHSYAQALIQQAAMVGSSIAAEQPLTLDALIPMLAALSHAFTHPQTLRTATPAQLAMFAAALANVSKHINAHVPVDRRDAFLSKLELVSVLKAVGDACVRLLDPAASGQEFASLAMRARETGLSRSSRAAVDALETAGLPRTRDDLRAAVRDVGDRRAQAAAVDVLERKYAAVAGEQELQADLDAMRALQAQVDAPAATARSSSRLARERVPEVATKFNPLQYPQDAALRAPCTMHDVAELAGAYARTGVSHPELMHKLCDRVLRAETAFASLTKGTSAATAPEEAIHDCTPHDTAHLVHAMALAAPASVARRVLTAVADAFVRERGWHDAGYGVSRLDEDDVSDDGASQLGGVDASDLPTSFDEHADVAPSASRARVVRLPPRMATRPASADDTLPLVRRSINAGAVAVSTAAHPPGSEVASARGTETRTTWSGRLLTRCSVEDHLQLLMAYAACVAPQREPPALIADDAFSGRLTRVLHSAAEAATPVSTSATGSTPVSWTALMGDVAARVGARAAEARPAQLIVAADALTRMQRPASTGTGAHVPAYAPLLRAIASSLGEAERERAPVELCDQFATAAARSMYAEMTQAARTDADAAQVWRDCETTLYHHAAVVQAASVLAASSDTRRRDAGVFAVLPVLLHVVHAVERDDTVAALVAGALADEAVAVPRWIPASATATVRRLQHILKATIAGQLSVASTTFGPALQRIRVALDAGVAAALRRHEQRAAKLQ